MTQTEEPPDPVASAPDLGTLALHAATELDRPSGSTSRGLSQSSRALAEHLRHLFPGGRPKLPPETIGLFCGLMESLADNPAEHGSYDRSNKTAKRIADMLERPTLSKTEREKIINFCLSLFYAMQPKGAMHDLPEDHPDILSMS